MDITQNNAYYKRFYLHSKIIIVKYFSSILP